VRRDETGSPRQCSGGPFREAIPHCARSGAGLQSAGRRIPRINHTARQYSEQPLGSGATLQV